MKNAPYPNGESFSSHPHPTEQHSPSRCTFRLHRNDRHRIEQHPKVRAQSAIRQSAAAILPPATVRDSSAPLLREIPVNSVVDFGVISLWTLARFHCGLWQPVFDQRGVVPPAAPPTVRPLPNDRYRRTLRSRTLGNKFSRGQAPLVFPCCSFFTPNSLHRVLPQAASCTRAGRLWPSCSPHRRDTGRYAPRNSPDRLLRTGRARPSCSRCCS